MGISVKVSGLKKNRAIKCWHSYLSVMRYKHFAYGPADATANPSFLASLKSRMTALPFWGELTQVGKEVTVQLHDKQL